jgi:hypothetical protein
VDFRVHKGPSNHRLRIEFVSINLRVMSPAG